MKLDINEENEPINIENNEDTTPKYNVCNVENLVNPSTHSRKHSE